MKIQDIAFIVILIIILLLRGKAAWYAGIVAGVAAGTLFLLSNLFTAQRFTWYSAAFFTVFVLKELYCTLFKNESK